MEPLLAQCGTEREMANVAVKTVAPRRRRVCGTTLDARWPTAEAVRSRPVGTVLRARRVQGGVSCLRHDTPVGHDKDRRLNATRRSTHGRSTPKEAEEPRVGKELVRTCNKRWSP